MTIQFRCPHCRKPYRVADDQGGRQVKCKACGRRLIIPEPVSAEPEEEANIVRHRERTKEFEPAFGDSANIEQISQHIETHVGKVASVFHELVSDLVHIDVHLVAPTDDAPYYTLITSGMSDKPMNAPDELPDCRHAELMLSLPPDWPLTQGDFADEQNYWPIRLLKVLARFPHEFDTWLWYGHSVPNGDPPEPFAAGTKLCCALVLAPALVPDAFLELPISADKTIHFFSVVPLYKEEVAFKLKHGADALVERFNEHDVTEVLDVKRRNVCKRGLWPL
jgi:predicted Zn finger-like uncharacterized protein